MRWGEGLVRLTVGPLGGQGQPYGDDVVAQVRELVEETRLGQKEIAAIVGVSHMTVSRWARSGGWRRPPGSARPLDELSDTPRAIIRQGARTLPWRLLVKAETLLASDAADLAAMEQALALVLEARDAHAAGIGPKRRRLGNAGCHLPNESGRLRGQRRPRRGRSRFGSVDRRGVAGWLTT
ncbi:helix-turn-helix domain-containing protein [Enterovirga rhinocerotis]|uniref:Uncharacterized protein n=1 Tax=Enterovirga rhinocerotis TaxID=1339210 RepID=A0A4R7CC19_9HYPH|nr:hypothetical protein [Enterovirga rhinocerotis]TDR94676.1 hypothetical protein EV668_1964 [Enterovirga rhinocerotis]